MKSKENDGYGRPLSAKPIQSIRDMGPSLIKGWMEDSIPCSTEERKRLSTARPHRLEYSGQLALLRFWQKLLEGGNTNQGSFFGQGCHRFCLDQSAPHSYSMTMANNDLHTLMDAKSIAWYTHARCTRIKPCQAWVKHDKEVERSTERYREETADINCPDITPIVLIKRKKHVFRSSRSPWTQSPSSITHPNYSLPGSLDFRAQSRSNPARPNPHQCSCGPGQETCQLAFPDDCSGRRTCSISRALCRRNEVPWSPVSQCPPPPAVPHCSYPTKPQGYHCSDV
ncbi:hypothetical protein DPEC_G00114610 [Dallia pectoralis]|uniref:Uncharacterized protein n=1 Tax=Dallia pectoralis TaxID=75939 RepID=A0ACC2GUE2_DALPE|nr:hypothetical protein DPEC_G00114610 [Dallia pectoralis]